MWKNPPPALPKAASRFRKREYYHKVKAARKAKIAAIRRDMAKARTVIRERYKSRGYIDWLKHEAEQGNIEAIYALRKRGAVAPALINITTRDLRDAKTIAAKIAHVTGRGTLFYRVGKDVFRDNGSHVSLKREVSDAGVEAALRIAMVKFNGQPLTVNGSKELKERYVEVAVRIGLPMTFSDAQMEKARQEHIRSASMQNDNAETIVARQKQPQGDTERKHRGMGR